VRVGEEGSASLSAMAVSLYICSISGVMTPRETVRCFQLFLERKERRCRLRTRLMEMSSEEMHASGERLASG
jgi:hypothetical protein